MDDGVEHFVILSKLFLCRWWWKWRWCWSRWWWEHPCNDDKHRAASANRGRKSQFVLTIGNFSCPLYNQNHDHLCRTIIIVRVSIVRRYTATNLSVFLMIICMLLFIELMYQSARQKWVKWGYWVSNTDKQSAWSRTIVQGVFFYCSALTMTK